MARMFFLLISTRFDGLLLLLIFNPCDGDCALTSTGPCWFLICDLRQLVEHLDLDSVLCIYNYNYAGYGWLP